jgi:hypothetical protein
VTTTEPVTTTTLESKDPDQAPDVTDDADIGGTNTGDTDTDATPEPELPGAPAVTNPATNAQPSSAQNAPAQANPVAGAQPSSTQQNPASGNPEIANATLPPGDGVTLLQRILDAA